MEDTSAPERQRETRARIGVGYGLAAYVWWGAVPIYFKAVAHVSAFEVLAHRVIWSVVLLGVLMRIYGRLRHAVAAVRRQPHRHWWNGGTERLSDPSTRALLRARRSALTLASKVQSRLR